MSDDGSLVAGLNAEDAAVRRVAARGLARLTVGDPGPALRARLVVESDALVLSELAFALGRHPSPSSAEALRQLIGEVGARVTPAVREQAILAFGRQGLDNWPATSVLVSALANGETPAIRGAAALALFRLDGRRYAHTRQVLEEELAARDTQLAASVQPKHEVDTGARWRASYALAQLRGRAGHATGLAHAFTDLAEPLTRLFALRGAGALGREALLDAAHFQQACGSSLAEALGLSLRDTDDRLAVEAARVLAQQGPARLLLDEGLAHRAAAVRRTAIESLRERWAAGDVEVQASALTRLQQLQATDPSAMVRREAAATIAQYDGVSQQSAGRSALESLARSSDARDRERAAQLLATGACRDEALLEALIQDSSPGVVAACLVGPAAADTPETDEAWKAFHVLVSRLMLGLRQVDPAPRAAAAEAARPLVEAGSAPPELLRALAESLAAATGLENQEARQALRRALGLPDEPQRPASTSPGRLLDRLLAEERQARLDPAPRVQLLTSRGSVTLELDRLNAPRHVASFLELAAAGFYDGLDFHRVVPNFVVQGLDPRGDGFGTGNRRLPDEINPRPFVTGTLGMPNAGEPHTGGCQIFITLLPTPHLDGGYTAFGQVVEGLDVVQRLEIGDHVTSVRRLP
ncbi:MAG: peptidylprolyl isomerase [Planctomycetota bacterium]